MVVGVLGTRREILATRQGGKWRLAWYVDDRSMIASVHLLPPRKKVAFFRRREGCTWAIQ